VLEFGLSEEVRGQDSIYVFSHLANNPKARYLAWKFLQDNWQTIYDRFSGGRFNFLLFFLFFFLENN